MEQVGVQIMYRLETKKNQHWTVNYQGVVMKPSIDESCFTELLFMSHLPPGWAGLPVPGCQAAETGGQAGEMAPPSFTSMALQTSGHDLGMMHLGLVLLFFPTTVAPAAAARAAGCCELHDDQLCAASSSFPIPCALLMFSALQRKLSAKSFLFH